jgi:hypothetical protein
MAFEGTLVRIRERTYLEVLDLAFVVVRSRPRALSLAALAGIAPVAALNAWLTYDGELPVPFYALMIFVEAPWATVFLTMVLGDLMFGQPVHPVRLLGRLLRALPSLIVYQFLLRLVLIVLIFPAPLIPAKLLFLNEVIVLERVGWRRTLSRSVQLCARRGGDLFVQWLGQLAFAAVFVLCFFCGTGAVISALTTNEMTWERPGWDDVYGARFQVGLWLALGFMAVARFFTYIDHRIRKEGWEVELRLRDVARLLEEARAW